MGPSSKLLGSWVEVFPAIPVEWLPRQVTDSFLLLFQGFFVSVFYCFFNGEVGDQAPRQSSVPSPMEPPASWECLGPWLCSALPWAGEGKAREITQLWETGILPEGVEPVWKVTCAGWKQ